MMVDDFIKDLEDKYGEEFNWHRIPLSNKSFVAELRNEIGKEHSLYDKDIFAVAKCESNDDVLFMVSDNDIADMYYIFHLTYSANNGDGFPKYKIFDCLESVKEYIEQSYIVEYL